MFRFALCLALAALCVCTTGEDASARGGRGARAVRFGRNFAFRGLRRSVVVVPVAASAYGQTVVQSAAVVVQPPPVVLQTQTVTQTTTQQVDGCASGAGAANDVAYGSRGFALRSFRSRR